MAKQKKHPSGTIAQNKKALHDYFIEQRFEAGVALAGWEVKSLRAGKAQLVDSYVLLKDGEAWLLGSHITPLTTASTHVIADPVRTRKLLLHTIKGLFDLLRRNVVTNIGGMYAQRTETRAQLMEQHQRLYDAIISGQAELAREVSNQHIHYVQEVLAEVQEEARRMKRSQRRRSVQED